MKKKSEVEKQAGKGEVETSKKKRGRKPKVIGDAPAVNTAMNGAANGANGVAS